MSKARIHDIPTTPHQVKHGIWWWHVKTPTPGGIPNVNTPLILHYVNYIEDDIYSQYNMFWG